MNFEPIAEKIIQAVMQQTPKRWLSLRQAAAYSEIGEKRLILLAKAGKIAGGQDTDTKSGEWVFDRQSIDTYRESQMLRPRLKDTESRVVAFLQKRT